MSHPPASPLEGSAGSPWMHPNWETLYDPNQLRSVGGAVLELVTTIDSMLHTEGCRPIGYQGDVYHDQVRYRQDFTLPHESDWLDDPYAYPDTMLLVTISDYSPAAQIQRDYRLSVRNYLQNADEVSASDWSIRVYNSGAARIETRQSTDEVVAQLVNDPVNKVKRWHDARPFETDELLKQLAALQSRWPVTHD